ncbi:DUF1989 domain-containing protein [Pleionea sediminis]|uniref:DUF1989 domain-containing protein n=1 Tax=Pleionea sediminis TaxID=2569479 RepID=UPI001185BD78|nr:urea carboxylase-associated family protein [Pleionea sediminis]
MKVVIPPKSGRSVVLKKNDLLKIIDPEGQQVADLYAFNEHELGENLSSGRSIDYKCSIYFSKGDILYSNRSNPMFEILEDTVGRHDFLLTPCAEGTFKHFYPEHPVEKGCFGNLTEVFKPYGIQHDQISTTFNVFMHVAMDENGAIDVLPPKSKAGDYILLEAKMDMIVGVTACSAGMSNNFAYKSIHFEVMRSN